MGRRRTGAARWTALLGAFVLSGCYTYVPVERPAPGTQVRLHVPVRSSVGSTDRDPEMVAFEGMLVSMGDTLVLQTRTQQDLGAHRELITMDTIKVLEGEYEGVEEKVFSGSRTAAFTAVLIGGAVLLGLAVDGLAGTGGEDDKGGGNGGNPQGLVVTGNPGWRIFGVRIPIPWPSG